MELGEVDAGRMSREEPGILPVLPRDQPDGLLDVNTILHMFFHHTRDAINEACLLSVDG